MVTLQSRFSSSRPETVSKARTPNDQVPGCVSAELDHVVVAGDVIVATGDV